MKSIFVCMKMCPKSALVLQESMSTILQFHCRTNSLNRWSDETVLIIKITQLVGDYDLSYSYLGVFSYNYHLLCSCLKKNHNNLLISKIDDKLE